MRAPSGAVDLYWIPLGADAHVVRVSGKLFEAVSAFAQRRARCDLFHSALEVHVPDGSYIIEQAPVPDRNGAARGVVAGGPVGTSWAGRVRLFRYEIRRWRDGRIPDVRQAIGSPVRVTEDVEVARRILDTLPSIPTPVWGRDQSHTGEMWNSNSVIAWVLARSGIDAASIRPPTGGRAPGWHAGLVVAARSGGCTVRVMQEQRRGRKIAITPEELDEYLGAERTCTVATVSHDGPHVTALWFVWDGECVWLYSITRSQRWADLERDPRVALLVEAGEEYNELRGVEVHGRVEVVGEVPRTGDPNDVLAEPERLFAAKYQGGGDGDMFHDGRHAWLKLTPTKIASWDFRKMGM